MRRPALDALAATTASAELAPAWRCASCGCGRHEAGRRAARRGRALHRGAVTCGEDGCQRERERQRLREKYGPGSPYEPIQRERDRGRRR